MQDIKNWLNSKKDYYEGVRIYLQYTRSPLFISLFKEEITQFKRDKLLQVMQAMLVRPKEPSPNPITHTPKATISHHAGPIAHKGWPNPITDPVIKKLWEQWRPVYAEMMSMQARVYEVAMEGGKGNPYKEQEAGEIALRILDLDDDCDEFYRQRDYYLLHGHLPGSIVERPVILTAERWATELKNAERYVRDYKVKLKKEPDNKLVVKWTETLKRYKDDICRYRKLLKLDE